MSRLRKIFGWNLHFDFAGSTSGVGNSASAQPVPLLPVFGPPKPRTLALAQQAQAQVQAQMQAQAANATVAASMVQVPLQGKNQVESVQIHQASSAKVPAHSEQYQVPGGHISQGQGQIQTNQNQLSPTLGKKLDEFISFAQQAYQTNNNTGSGTIATSSNLNTSTIPLPSSLASSGHLQTDNHTQAALNAVAAMTPNLPAKRKSPETEQTLNNAAPTGQSIQNVSNDASNSSSSTSSASNTAITSTPQEANANATASATSSQPNAELNLAATDNHSIGNVGNANISGSAPSTGTATGIAGGVTTSSVSVTGTSSSSTDKMAEKGEDDMVDDRGRAYMASKPWPQRDPATAGASLGANAASKGSKASSKEFKEAGKARNANDSQGSSEQQQQGQPQAKRHRGPAPSAGSATGQGLVGGQHPSQQQAQNLVNLFALQQQAAAVQAAQANIGGGMGVGVGVGGLNNLGNFMAGMQGIDSMAALNKLNPNLHAAIQNLQNLQNLQNSMKNVNTPPNVNVNIQNQTQAAAGLQQQMKNSPQLAALFQQLQQVQQQQQNLAGFNVNSMFQNAQPFNGNLNLTGFNANNLKQMQNIQNIAALLGNAQAAQAQAQQNTNVQQHGVNIVKSGNSGSFGSVNTNGNNQNSDNRRTNYVKMAQPRNSNNAQLRGGPAARPDERESVVGGKNYPVGTENAKRYAEVEGSNYQVPKQEEKFEKLDEANKVQQSLGQQNEGREMVPGSIEGQAEVSAQAGNEQSGVITTSGNTFMAVQEESPEQRNRKLKVEDALRYLDEVKKHFSHNPNVYIRFLDVMRKFKSQGIDTPGVIAKVLQLFKDHDDLILGFNNFLPPGYKIVMVTQKNGKEVAKAIRFPTGEQDSERKRNPTATDAIHRHIQILEGRDCATPTTAEILERQIPDLSSQSQLHLPNEGNVQLPMNVPNVSHSLVPVNDLQSINAGLAAPGAPVNIQIGSAPVSSSQGQAQGIANVDGVQRSDPTEFNQAIDYVTRIKKRFEHDSDTYRCFLDILHNYQKEATSIKTVLGKVSVLFEDHPDLLKEFTFFLPVNARPNADKMLRRIMKKRKNRVRQNRDIEAGEELKDASRKLHKEPKAVKGRTSMGKDKEKRIIPQLEAELLRRIKCYLPTNAWKEFVHLLHLLCQGLLNRQELITLCADVFAAGNQSPLQKQTGVVTITDFQIPNLAGNLTAPQYGGSANKYDVNVNGVGDLLLKQLDELLCSRGVTDNAVENAWWSLPMSEIDFTNAPRCTPSYRLLPASYPKLHCSERTMLCKDVLNDQWVSVPTGSEDFGFRNMRRNIYEENLFKCEDERYFLDMVIEQNKSAIYALEKINREIDAYKERLSNIDAERNQLVSYTATDKSSYPKMVFRMAKNALSMLHLKAIAKVYGRRASDLLELLSVTPLTAVPVILKRLKEKDQQWVIRREQLNVEWKRVLETNFYKSLDHRSFYFKQSDKKETAAKALGNQIKNVYRDSVKDVSILKGYKGEMIRFNLKNSFNDVNEKEDIFEENSAILGRASEQSGDANIELYFDDVETHKDVMSLLIFAVKKGDPNNYVGNKLFLMLYYFLTNLMNLPKSIFSLTDGAGDVAQIGKEDLEISLLLLRQPGSSLLDKLRKAKLNKPLFGRKQPPALKEVSTPYGKGLVELTPEGALIVNPRSGMVRVKLSYGTGYFHQLLLKESKNISGNVTAFNTSNMEVDNDTGKGENSKTKVSFNVQDYIDQNGTLSFLGTSDMKVNGSTIYGSNSCYLFFRYYHILYERLLKAKYLCGNEPNHGANISIGATGPSTAKNEDKQKAYDNLLQYIYEVIGGQISGTDFEEKCRTVLHSNAFFMFTIDRIIAHLEKHTCQMLNDDKTKTVVAALNRFRETKSLSDGSKVYRSIFLAMMNQVEGSAFKFRFLNGTRKAMSSNEWETRPRLEISLVNDFPCLGLNSDTEFAAFEQSNTKNLFRTIAPFEIALNFRDNEVGSEFDEFRLKGTSSNANMFPTAFTVPLFYEVCLPLSDEAIARLKALKPHFLASGDQPKKLGKNSWWFAFNEDKVDNDKKSGSTEETDQGKVDVEDNGEEGDGDGDGDVDMDKDGYENGAIDEDDDNELDGDNAEDEEVDDSQDNIFKQVDFSKLE